MIEWLHHVWLVFLTVIESANPVWLFLAIAILPLLGFPASPLVIAIGIRLGTQIGMAFVAAAYLINFSIGYWMARHWFRAALGRWLERRGRGLPQISAANETQFILLMRIIPGPPLFMQTYALGLARVNFARYLILSMVIQMFYVAALLFFGQSLNHNSLWRIIFAVSLLIGVALMVSLLRRRMTLRRKSSMQP